MNDLAKAALALLALPILGTLFSVREVHLAIAGAAIAGACFVVFGTKIAKEGKIFLAFWGAMLCAAQLQTYIDKGKPKPVAIPYYHQNQSGSGQCDHSWQYAKDGSKCGDRAADRK